jgi:hypothetical protein
VAPFFVRRESALTLLPGSCVSPTIIDVGTMPEYRATPEEERPNMFLIREIMYCKPGKVRAMVEKFVAMSKLNEKVGMPKMRVMTDFCAEQYWTIVAEMEVPDLDSFERMMSNPQGPPDELKKFEQIMKGYHDLVDHGKREIYKIES